MTDDPIKKMHAVRDFPAVTCGASRHAARIAELLCKSGPYATLFENPDYRGGSIAATVTALWECRAKLAKALTWQPIETAPKDGTPFLTFSQYAFDNQREGVLGYFSTPILVMSWLLRDTTPCPVDDNGDWHDFHNYDPTHWMPLPEPPAPPTQDT